MQYDDPTNGASPYTYAPPTQYFSNVGTPPPPAFTNTADAPGSIAAPLPGQPLTLAQIIQMNQTGGVAIGSPNDQQLAAAGIPNSLGPRTPAPVAGGGGPSGGPAPTAPGSTVGDISQFPTFNPPTPTPQQGLTAPSPYTFTPFVNGTFTAPTLAEAQAQPGYAFGLQQGQDALQNSAAARGTLRGGGTLKDLFGYTNAAAEQNYGNVYNQDLSTFNTNEGDRFNTWAANQSADLNANITNFGVAQTVNNSVNAANQQNYTNAYQNAAGTFNPQFQAAQLTFADSYNRWLAKLNSLTNIATAGGS